MLDPFRILLPTLAALFHVRHDLVVENLLLRHQLQVRFALALGRTSRRDRFVWLVVRRLYPAWRRHLVLIRPETVVRWHRRGWCRTVRRECLDHLIPISEHHLRAILTEFVHYYNHDRPHRSLGLQPPVPQTPERPHGGVSVRPVLSGLHHVYEHAV